MNKLKRNYVYTALVCAAIIFSVLRISFATTDTIPPITMTELRSILQDNKGKVVVVDLWATWCPPCRKEIPGFINLYNKYKNNGVEIIGIAFDENGSEVVPEFVKNMGINYPVYLAGNGIDVSYGLRAYPTTIIYDKNGNMASKHVGYVTEEAFDQEIATLLKK
ncbi:MAG: TlpA family protein disulfide reductase [Candidatus Kuenenia sp.]|nr:TlpA family protein disulfide reductase [Candidatus Kuenenia hertensis]